MYKERGARSLILRKTKVEIHIKNLIEDNFEDHNSLE
jgi:hypothetical protein